MTNKIDDLEKIKQLNKELLEYKYKYADIEKELKLKDSQIDSLENELENQKQIVFIFYNIQNNNLKIEINEIRFPDKSNSDNSIEGLKNEYENVIKDKNDIITKLQKKCKKYEENIKSLQEINYNSDNSELQQNNIEIRKHNTKYNIIY